MSNTYEMVDLPDGFFKKDENADRYGINHRIWIMRQVMNLDDYWKDVIINLLKHNKVSSELCEIIGSIDKKHLQNKRQAL
jgi:alpha-galactosidase/6-phospho-beta-glucosidase family protein